MLTLQSLKALRLFFLQDVFILLLHLGKLRHWVVSWSVGTSAEQGAASFSSLALTSVPLSLTGRCEAAPLVSSWLRNSHCVSTLLPYYFPTVASSWATLLSAKFHQAFWPQLWLSTKAPPTAKQCTSLLRCHTHQHPPSAYYKRGPKRSLCLSQKG